MVTLRMVASTIASTCGPLSSRNWTGSLCENFAHWLELARTNPAITIETKTCNTPRQTLADTARSPLTASLSCGAKVCNAAVRLVEAKLQRSLSFLPTKGQVSTFSGGGGILRVPS
jgi:hypothetical protein